MHGTCIKIFSSRQLCVSATYGHHQGDHNKGNKTQLLFWIEVLKLYICVLYKIYTYHVGWPWEQYGKRCSV